MPWASVWLWRVRQGTVLLLSSVAGMLSATRRNDGFQPTAGIPAETPPGCPSVAMPGSATISNQAAIATEDPMLISPAYAQAAAPAAGGDMFMSLLPLVLVFAIFYFLLIRPQQTKMKQHRAMLENLKKGDQIVTARRHRRQDRADRAERQFVDGRDRAERAGQGRSARRSPTC